MYYRSCKNVINKLCLYMDNRFHSYRHSHNFEAYFPVHSFFACYIHMLCFADPKKNFVSYCYNYYNPILNKHLKKIDKNFRHEKDLFLLLKYLLFLYHHCLFDHYLFRYHYHQKYQNVLHLNVDMYKVIYIKYKVNI